ncbi:TPA: hypothetical protein DCE37_15210 [Candidatus Latescibacteria bacterium]|nr:hypothetical protein [Candidatus Latescibacterota bacterium]
MNVRSDAENTAYGPNDRKGSGMLSVDGKLYLLARNDNRKGRQSRIGWSTDRARTFEWCKWNFRELGHPTFVNYGKDYAGGGRYVYIWSKDHPSAYEASGHFVLGRVLKDRIRERDAYEFFGRMRSGKPVWSSAIEKRGPAFKMKCISDDPMVARIRAILEATDASFKCTVDPNQRFYRPSEAIALARAFEPFGNVAELEDPMAKWNLDWCKQLREATTIPVALHLANPHDIINAIKAEAVDCLNIVGSMAQFVKSASIADAAGLPIWHGSGCDLGIIEMSYFRAISVARNCVLPSDLVGSFVREDDLIEEGHSIVPNEQGLGCKLDMDAVDRYAISNEKLEV